MDQKKCKSCEQTLDVDKFYRDRKGYYSSYCKECDKAKSRKWHADNPEARAGHWTHSYAMKTFGISGEEYTSMIESADLCPICMVRKATDLDHDHETGRIRDVLCHNCNVALGHFGDNAEWLLSAVEYLRRYSGAIPEDDEG